uniref:L-lactate dehydrogenase n=1 Tax=Mantoniella antarctica TaxID=81844 RepID=A0A7S0X607_9CHLO
MATPACSSGVRAIGYAGATHRGSRDSAYPRACVPASVRHVNREETLQLLSRSRRCKSACVVQATGSVSLREDLFGSKEPLFTDCRSSKVSIVGSGQVGLACAYALINQATCRQIVLHDIAPKMDRLEAEVADLLHGAEFVDSLDVVATADFADTADSDIVIIPAGARQNEGESRLALVARNVAIFEDIIPKIAAASPDAKLLILTNPCDIMTHVALRLSGFPSNRVIGSGTALDTSRFRSLLAHKLAVDTGSVHGMVLGEHGDSSVVLWSQVMVGGGDFEPAYSYILYPEP